MRQIKAAFTRILALFLLLLLAGCGSDASDTQEKKEKKSREKAEKTVAEEDPGEDESEASQKEEQKPDPESTLPETPDSAPTLAEKLCGRYSCETGDGEYEILDLLTFGGNLYGFGGNAMADEGSETLEAYSFWALEFIPEDPSILQSTETEECEVYELAFSIMSNLGRYFTAPTLVTFQLTTDGIMYGGSAASEGAPAVGRLFVRDDRVESCLPYLNDDSVPSDTKMPDLTGLWRQTGSEKPVYLDFQEHGNFMIYRKSPAEEVKFGGGHYEIQPGNVLSCLYSTLETADMPYTLEGEAETDGKKLTLRTQGYFSESEWMTADGEDLTFERITPDQIPLITYQEVSDAGINENYVSPMMEMEAVWAAESSFYGVWTGAFRTDSEAYEQVEKLTDAGFDAIVAYSPDWEGLNPQPYFCVSAGRCDTQEEAETLLKKVKAAGYSGAYVKETGQRISHRVTYIMYSLDEAQFDDENEVILRSVQIEDPVGYEYHLTLTVDADTVFDENCLLDTFGGYEKGDTPLSWFQKNKKYADTDPDAYMANGPALSGTFEVSVTNGHIDRFYSCGWWD